MTKTSVEFQISVNRPNKEVEKGILKITRNGPSITLENGERVSDQQDVYFKLDNCTEAMLPIGQNESVHLKPSVSITMGFAPLHTTSDLMYPPSTKKWITHVVEGGKRATYTVHNIRESQRKLLIITSLDDSNDFISYRVQPYETLILSMTHDLIVQNQIREYHKKTSNLFSILEKSPPSWSTIDRLVEEVNIPNLSIKATMGETLEQLIPSSFPERARKQIIAFLAWTETAEVPSEDPMDFIQRYAEHEVFSALVTGHLKCLLQRMKPPPYVRIMAQADAGSLKLTERPTLAAVEQNPWYMAQLQLYLLFPDWMKRVLELTDSLYKKGKIIVELPVTKREARKSKTSWGDRFALITQGLAMRGYVQRDSLGLKTIVYVGAAHKWPHTHLEISARLGYQTEKSPQLQLMVIPQSAVERVARILPSIHEIEWETLSSNLSLYDSRISRWRMNTTTLLKSLERSRSLRQIENEFGKWSAKKPVSLTPIQAKVLDMISWGIYLVNLEDDRYSKYYKIDNQTIKNTLEELKEQGVFKLLFLTTMQKLTSIFVTANGPANHVCSLARSFLKHAPTSDVRIADKGTSCFIISRVPEHDAFELLTSLPSRAAENEVNLTARPISAYIGYRNNLYQRLLRDDGSWDDDISGLISQARLRPKGEN